MWVSVIGAGFVGGIEEDKRINDCSGERFDSSVFFILFS